MPDSVNGEILIKLLIFQINLDHGIAVDINFILNS